MQDSKINADPFGSGSTTLLKELGNLLKMSAREPQERRMEAGGLVLSSMLLKSLVAGGLASMCGKTAVAPLDRIKILFQVHSILLYSCRL
jgi:hypothetical protein